MYESAVPSAEAQQQDASPDIGDYVGAQQQMDMENTIGTPTHEYVPIEPTNDLEHTSPVDSRIRQESSDEDDMPIRNHRPHGSHEQSASTIPVHEQLSFPKPAKGSPLNIGKTRKRPGPKPYAAKPIAKNDMKAKMEVIRAIEKNWGKNFITNYIPKCHRPLQKKKGGKRTAYRQHETDPRKWLPSVLKAVLMISSLTSDKAFLKKAMNDIVRHRIKHTGNRKPQLVTTDFDVVEDMLTRGWDVETSFSVRYKHLLLTQPKGYLETDEDIDHILACGDDDFQPGSDGDGGGEDQDEDDMEVDGQEDDSAGFSSPDQQRGAYIHGAPHQPPKMIVSKQSRISEPIKKEKQDKPAKTSKHSSIPNRPSASPSLQQMPQHIYGGYGMPGYGPYGGYPGFPPIPGYSPPHMKGYPPQPPYTKGYPPSPLMYPWPGYGQYPGYGPQVPNKNSNYQDPRVPTPAHLGYGYPSYGYSDMLPHPHPILSSSSVPPSTSAQPSIEHSASHPRISPFSRSRRSSSYRPDKGPTHYDASSYPMSKRIKCEPGVEDYPIPIEDHGNGPSNYLGGAVDSDEQMRNEISEQERHVQALKEQLEKKSRG